MPYVFTEHGSIMAATILNSQIDPPPQCTGQIANDKRRFVRSGSPLENAMPSVEFQAVGQQAGDEVFRGLGGVDGGGEGHVGLDP